MGCVAFPVRGLKRFTSTIYRETVATRIVSKSGATSSGRAQSVCSRLAARLQSESMSCGMSVPLCGIEITRGEFDCT